MSSLNGKNVGTAVAALFDKSPPQAHVDPLVKQLLTLAAKLGDKDSLSVVFDRIVSVPDGQYAAWQLAVMPEMLRAAAQRQVKLTDAQAQAWHSMVEQGRALLADPQTAEELRVLAIGLLPLAGGEAADVERMARGLAPQATGVQRASLEALAATGTAAAAAALLNGLEQLTPAVQATALDEVMSRESLTAELLGRLESGVLPRGLIDAAPGSRSSTTRTPRSKRPPQPCLPLRRGRRSQPWPHRSAMSMLIGAMRPRGARYSPSTAPPAIWSAGWGMLSVPT